MGWSSGHNLKVLGQGLRRLYCAIQGDFPASKMLNSLPGIDPVRRAKLIEVLDINPEWRMHTVSDGQRRRVQICLGLLKPFDVLLLDEITVDLDVLGRADLMQFLKEECQQRGATNVDVRCSALPSLFLYCCLAACPVRRPGISAARFWIGCRMCVRISGVTD